MLARSTAFFAISSFAVRGVSGPACASGLPASAACCAFASVPCARAAAARRAAPRIHMPAKVMPALPARPDVRSAFCTGPPSDGDEEAALVREGSGPGDLRDRVLDGPVVSSGSEEPVRSGRLGAEGSVRKGAQPVDAVVAEPAANFADGVGVLLDVLVLVS